MQTPDLPLPDGWVLDPDVTAHRPQDGIWWVILPDGTRTAWNEHALPCPVCKAELAKMPDCSECAGRGVVDTIPYCDRPWDRIMQDTSWSSRPVGEVWLGGIHCQFGHPDAPGGNAF